MIASVPYLFHYFIWKYHFLCTPPFSGTQLGCKTRPTCNAEGGGMIWGVWGRREHGCLEGPPTIFPSWLLPTVHSYCSYITHFFLYHCSSWTRGTVILWHVRNCSPSDSVAFHKSGIFNNTTVRPSDLASSINLKEHSWQFCELHYGVQPLQSCSLCD